MQQSYCNHFHWLLKNLKYRGSCKVEWTMNAGVSVGYAVAFIVVFIVGLVLGVLGCTGAIKFVEWMRGKALFFTPWPRVQPLQQ